jgi:hypothetical protein
MLYNGAIKNKHFGGIQHEASEDPGRDHGRLPAGLRFHRLRQR